ncbi:MAG: aspartate-semialdehyde dehydrogenase [Saprospiraceae bacterium]|nr:aspartate-semialdehyde dehydrogenase [Candidatus Vicinibacter affinis]MBP6172893.1 aspartate-semialdehyde dehydrogenase [Saprospiraceae bacterium]MBK6572985.1 aspartate-semialdehyde dehydrogenase [Candidatus Vicinibacter affinis]MBK7301675.1 aspartate-semialdehyde dehydrogenase [Candidatus Vicinibacter affinis]MBK7692813.1 aspartate-semialdehyde dehydrogenase [Candidatus Vicinibacter affinis]
MKIAVVGVTGMVGQVMLQVLKEMGFASAELIPVASEQSIGKTILWNDRTIPIISMEDAIALKPAIAIFSAGGATSTEFAPKFAAAGSYVIDNSSAWRMDPSCPLVVPEINSGSITEQTKIIANPNCSTIQMVMALAPLHRQYSIDRIVVSTYQSFTGTGMKAVRQYEAERDGNPVPEPRAYHHPIFENCIPHCDVFLENGYTKEEMKLVHETRKILCDPSLKITATAVRVPVHGGHSESVNVTFKKDFHISDIRNLLKQAPGLVLLDNPEKYEYPTPLLAKNMNEVFVGRIRLDESQPRTINLWITADNLRKGAATNAVQIAKYLVEQGFC